MAELSDELVGQVSDFTGLDRHVDRAMILAALKDKNNNIECVVADFYDDAEKFRQKYVWDESAFTTDREGTTDLANVPTFNIYAPDEGTAIEGVAPTPPTRPPSRTNNRSPLGRLVDLTAEDAAGAHSQMWNGSHSDRLIGAPSNKAQEDADLQRAIAESVAQQSGYHTPQESGVVQGDNTNNPFFGPANRCEYDPNKWGMVPVTAGGEEPGPSGRKRIPGTPAFLRSRRGWYEHRLGAILTILHEIPAARNLLLSSGSTEPATYGTNGDWWKGAAIVPMGADTEGMSWAQELDPPFSEEVHRLVAFLDATDRSYGTADVLANIKSPAADQDPSEAESNFYTALEVENGEEKTRALWTATEVVPVGGGAPVDSVNFGFLDAALDKAQYASVQTLYNVLDALFWGEIFTADGADFDNATMAVIKTPSEVFSLRLGGEGLAHPIEIPEVLYLDRYLREQQANAAMAQYHLSRVFQTIGKASKLEESAGKWVQPQQPETQKIFDRRALSQKTVERDRQRITDLKADALWRRHQELKDTERHFDYLPGTMDHMIEFTPQEQKVFEYYEAHARLFQHKIAGIDEKLAKFRSEREACQKLLQKLSERGTHPSEAGSWNPTHKYCLRGVATSLDVIYVCRREINGGEGAGSEPQDQWWRLAYVPNDPDAVKVEKTTIDVALRAACEETDKPILIYATEKALNEGPVPLSGALKTFVRFDNRLFKQEIIESPIERKRVANISPISPAKRHNRSNSADSMATNRASIGSDAPEDMVLDGDAEILHGEDPSAPGQEYTTTTTTDAHSAEGAPYGHIQLLTDPQSKSATDESPTMRRESLRLANVSLSETQVAERFGQMGPEMQERSGPSPFITRPKSGAFETMQPSVDVDVEMPTTVAAAECDSWSRIV